MNSRVENLSDCGQPFGHGRRGIGWQEGVQLLKQIAGASNFPCPMPSRKTVWDGFVECSIAADPGRHKQGQALQRTAKDLEAPFKRLDALLELCGHFHSSLVCCGTAKLEAPAAASSVSGGGLRPFVNAFPEAA